MIMDNARAISAAIKRGVVSQKKTKYCKGEELKLEGNGPVESAASRAIKDKHEVH